jgi:DnaJ-class molecular chaperone
MFKDYYAILEIDVSASQDDIKSAFKKQALRWHPDRNIGKDTTSIMQDINEAKLILLDNEARERYNREYDRFKAFQRQKEYEKRQQEKQREEQRKEQRTEEQKQYQKTTSQSRDFKVEDEILNKWMSNAKKQAVDLAKETIEDLKGMTKEGVKAASEKVGSQIPSLLIMAVIFLIIALSIKTCNT